MRNLKLHTFIFRFGILLSMSGVILPRAPGISSAAELAKSLPATCMSDNFNNSSLDPAWNWIDPLGDSLYSLSDNPGFLRIQALAGNRDFATGNKNAPRLSRSISGDFDIQTKLTVDPVQTYQSAGLFIWIDEANFMWIGRSVGNVIGHKYVRDDSEDGLNPPQPNYSDTTVYFRMVRKGATFSTYYSANGVYWTMTGFLDYPVVPEVINAGVFLLNNWQDNPFQADFDYFRVNCSANLVYLPMVNKPVKPAVLEKIVFTIAYIDATPINDPDSHQREFLAGLREGSTWHGYANPNGTPSLGYTTYGGAVIKLYESPPHRSDTGQFDYAAVYQRFDLCTKVQQGLVDEVWIWESGDGNAWEWVTNGPNWTHTEDTNVPNCGKTVTTLNLNYQREIDVAYESYSHRLETALKSRYPCDFFTETWPWTGWPSQCTGLVSDRYGFVARPFAGNNYIGVCGDAHTPPNVLEDNRPYVYDDPTYVQSICEDWQWNGTAQVKTINCTEWDCTHRGFHIWWMQNLPGYGNNNHDRYGNVRPDWWESLFE